MITYLEKDIDDYFDMKKEEKEEGIFLVKDIKKVLDEARDKDIGYHVTWDKEEIIKLYEKVWKEDLPKEIANRINTMIE